VEEFSIDLFSDNLIHFISEFKIEKAHVFGYSMGGFVALDAAYQFPANIDKIVTLGTKFEWSPRISVQEIRQLNPELIEDKVPRFPARLAELHPANDWKENMEMTADLMVELGEQNGFDNDLLEEINHDVTIGWGTEDRMVFKAESEFVANHLTNGRFYSLSNQPHPIEKVDLDVLVNYIRSTLL